jgi:hypothetical protein
LSASDAEEGVHFGGGGGETLWGGALRPGVADETLGLFLLPAGRPGRRFGGANDEVPTVRPVDLFLLPRGWPQPRFSTGAPRLRRDPPASAMETGARRKNPRWDDKKEDDAAEEDNNERIRVFTLNKHALFISKS